MSTQFQHVSSIGSKDRVSSLEDNIKSFLDWSFLNIGGYINVSIPTSGINTTNNFSTLKPVNNPSAPSGTTWETVRKDWVYESGINYNGNSPAVFSGVYLNSIFLPAPTGSGNHGYRVNYPLGRINFSFNVAASSTVVAAYSYKYIQVYKSSDAAWWKEVQKETYNPDSFKQTNEYSIAANHRVQLPAIVIELIPRTILSPYELGTTENIVTQDLLLHIFTQNANQRNSIIDTLLLQKDNTFWLYDTNQIVKENKTELKLSGEINPSGINYPSAVNLYKNHWIMIKNSTIVELNTLSSTLYNGVVRWSMEILP